MNREEKQKIRLGKIPDSAAGPLAVFHAMRMALKAMNPLKTLKILHRLNQNDGIDCPGCAWPDPKKRAGFAEYCENGVKAIAEESMDRSAGIDFFQKYSIPELLHKSDHWLGQQGRLIHPMILEPGSEHYQPVDWDVAFTTIANQLNDLDSPDEAIFYTSGRTSNEAAFLYQLFVRMYGTNNLPDCSNMCHESSGVALTETLGLGKGSVTLEDFDKTDLILIFGQNPATNHPRMLAALESAKKNGAAIVSVNPLKEVGLLKFNNPQTIKGWLGAGTKLSDYYLQVKINEDVAVLKYFLKKLLQLSEKNSSAIDSEFIGTKTLGFDALKSDLANYNLNDLANRAGIDTSLLDEVCELIAGRKKIIVCWAMGLTQHVNAVDNIREIVNLLLLKGSVGKPGAGTCPVRGHSNVQGDRTVGITERPPKAFLDKLAQNLNFNPPRTDGYNVVEAIHAMKQGKAKVFMGMGGNFYSAAPDSTYTAEALSNCSLTVHVSTKLNRSHLMHGKTALILPCLSRTEMHGNGGKRKFITVENSMGVVHSSKGVLKPRSKHLLGEPDIIAGIASVLLPDSPVDWFNLCDDYNNIREMIEQNIEGFDNYNARIKSDSKFDLPNSVRNGVFSTETGKAHFSVNQMSATKAISGEFVLMTIRSHDQFNTTIYGLDDRYRGIFNGRKVVFMNEEDIRASGMESGELVDIYNEHYGRKRVAPGFKIVPYDIPSGNMAAYYPETNVLVPIEEMARGSFTPASKSVLVKIKKSVHQQSTEGVLS